MALVCSLFFLVALSEDRELVPFFSFHPSLRMLERTFLHNVTVTTTRGYLYNTEVSIFKLSRMPVAFLL